MNLSLCKIKARHASPLCQGGVQVIPPPFPQHQHSHVCRLGLISASSLWSLCLELQAGLNKLFALLIVIQTMLSMTEGGRENKCIGQ